MVTVGLSPWAKSVVLHRIIGAMASFGSTYKAQERAHKMEENTMKNQEQFNYKNHNCKIIRKEDCLWGYIQIPDIQAFSKQIVEKRASNDTFLNDKIKITFRGYQDDEFGHCIGFSHDCLEEEEFVATELCRIIEQICLLMGNDNNILDEFGTQELPTITDDLISNSLK